MLPSYFSLCVILSEAKKPGFRKRVQQNSNSKAYFVYIMSNLARTLYTGVTNNLERRSNEHKTGAIPGFTKRYKIDRLVYFQETNDITEAIAAEKYHADFIVFGPVFATPGKTAVGLEPLREVASRVRIPVLAIGGVTAAIAEEILNAGAAGIAGIRIFQAQQTR